MQQWEVDKKKILISKIHVNLLIKANFFAPPQSKIEHCLVVSEKRGVISQQTVKLIVTIKLEKIENRSVSQDKSEGNVLSSEAGQKKERKKQFLYSDCGTDCGSCCLS